MSGYQTVNRAQKAKIISKLERQIATLNKALAALPPLCDCETQNTSETKLALANELAALWEREFQKELETGIRASMDFMDPAKNDGP